MYVCMYKSNKEIKLKQKATSKESNEEQSANKKQQTNIYVGRCVCVYI